VDSVMNISIPIFEQLNVHDAFKDPALYAEWLFKLFEFHFWSSTSELRLGTIKPRVFCV
jgi:hypothetical protein